MNKILVTGATGFVGNHVIEELLTRGENVIATSTSLVKAKQFDWFDKVSFVPFDLKSNGRDQDLFQYFGEPNKLIHLAWEGLPNYKSEFHLTDNLPRHATFLKNIMLGGLKDISVIGTCLEYGLQEGCLSEAMPTIPSNPYAQAKDQLRKELELFADDHQVDLKWIRLFYMYGKGQNPNSLLSQLQKALDNGDEVFNMSPGDQLRDYLPVEKVAEYIVSLALRNEYIGVINCCSGEPIQVKALVSEYLASRNAKINLNLGHYPYSDIEPRNFWGDNKKLKTILNNE